MNLSELFNKYDFHDSYLEYLDYSFNERRLSLCLNLGDWQEHSRCVITFCNIILFHLEADNVDFKGNTLISFNTLKNEYFKGFFCEDFGKPGKFLEVKCEYIEFELS
jgi:hypothetical protein